MMYKTSNRNASKHKQGGHGKKTRGQRCRANRSMSTDPSQISNPGTLNCFLANLKKAYTNEQFKPFHLARLVKFKVLVKP